MRRKLFTVEDTFKIPGRGTVITSFQPTDLPEIKLESPLVLVLPEGQEILTEVGGVEHFQTISGNKGIGILVKKIAKEDVPTGTIVFLDASDKV